MAIRAQVTKMGRMLNGITAATNRVRVVYDDGTATFDLPPGATLGDLVEMIDVASDGHRTVSVNVSIDSQCLAIA
jgi:hypothetical protein